jgi:hypothetical protein
VSNYETSSHKKPTGKARRFVVTYEEDTPGGVILTFGVRASLASEATAKVIEFIRIHKLHQSEHPYTLYPKVSKDITNYNVNF